MNNGRANFLDNTDDLPVVEELTWEQYLALAGLQPKDDPDEMEPVTHSDGTQRPAAGAGFDPWRGR